MGRDLSFPPLFRWRAAVQGLSAGGLLVSGIVSPLGLAVQAAFFISGLLIFIDSLIPNGEVSILTVVFFGIVGGLLSLVGVYFGFHLLWAILAAVIAVAFYSSRWRKSKEKRIYLREEGK